VSQNSCNVTFFSRDLISFKRNKIRPSVWYSRDTMRRETELANGEGERAVCVCVSAETSRSDMAQWRVAEPYPAASPLIRTPSAARGAAHHK
jgi:hypothetical protein